MKILGIHQGHDSSAAAVIDGKVVADVQEERFNRVKHSSDLPMASILYCMEQCGIEDINGFDRISFSWSTTPPHLASVLNLPIKKSKTLKQYALNLAKKFFGANNHVPPIYFKDLKLKDPTKFINNDHHRMHAASAYFTRKSNDKCLIFTADGAGDNVSTAVWLASGNKIKPLSRLSGFEAGIGWAYSIVTEGLHWIHGDGEGKTMGLAPYGDPKACKGKLDHLFPVFNGTELSKPSKIQKGNSFMLRGSNQFHFEQAREVEKLVEEFGREAIAAEAQRKLEEVMIGYVQAWCLKMEISKVAAAGGLFLNVKLNQRIWENRGTIMDEYHVYPNPADSGLAVGAALHEYYQHNRFNGATFDHLYLGPEYSDAYIENVLKTCKVNYEKLSHPAKTAAKYLANNKIIAWFQGRMESGPRALGNRSILMSPIHPENKNTINAYVKFREGFRPFCPSLLYEHIQDYLIDSKEELFMITSYTVQPDKKNRIPAVVHQDGTLRAQMVKRELNPCYWELINEFGNLTGEYIVLNTSFNVMGEPIINTPEEALRGFFGSGIDLLFIGDFIVYKK
ncbi:hypothetical protein OA501_00030 [Flavobacteriaceae bacterium]|nr:hypothetical protein [Flavobacteriaceae bacterium]